MEVYGMWENALIGAGIGLIAAAVVLLAVRIFVASTNKIASRLKVNRFTVRVLLLAILVGAICGLKG
jgi:hypothetical protein